MSADLHIHTMKGIDEGVLARFFCNTLGSKYFRFTSGWDEEAHELVSATPNIWVGEVSWLKAGLFNDPEHFVPDVVQAVSEAVGEDLPVIDDAFIEKISIALDSGNTTSYRTAEREAVLAFLNEHRGERAFTVSW